MRSHDRYLFVTIVCMIIAISLAFMMFGCKNHLNKLCTDWLKDAKTVDKAIIKARDIHAEDPNRVTCADIEALEDLRDRIMQDAGKACALDELIQL